MTHYLCQEVRKCVAKNMRRAYSKWVVVRSGRPTTRGAKRIVVESRG